MSYPLQTFINNKLSENVDYVLENLISDLTSIFDRHLYIKNDEDLVLFCYDGCGTSEYKTLSDEYQELGTSLRSCFVDKTNLSIIASQFNNIIYNSDTLNYIKNRDWNNIVISECYEGTLVTVFNHNSKWYISTRKCIDSKKSFWGNKTYYDLFNEVKTFDLDDLDKNNFYLFILIHPSNNIIVNNTKRMLRLCNVVEKCTLKEIHDYKNLNNMEISFNNIDDVQQCLSDINQRDVINGNISTEGFILKVYDGDKYNSPFKVLKLQTDIYKEIAMYKANTSNKTGILLHFYQLNKLNEYKKYFSNDSSIVNQIHNGMNNLSYLLLNIYYSTRNKKNAELYNSLPGVYKSVLYNIHNLYIQNKCPIKMNHIYDYLKTINITMLMNLFEEWYITYSTYNSDEVYNIKYLLSN